jgi:hypothetical protein
MMKELNMTKPTSTEKEIASALSIRDQILADDTLAAMASPEGQDARVESVNAKKPLTADVIEDRVSALMQVAVGLFYDPDERVLGNNGKAYPLNYDFEHREDVESTGEVVTVDRHAFINKSFSYGVCSALDYQLRSQEQNIARQRNAIRNEISFARNTGTDDQGKVERMADFLGAMVERAAAIEVALKAAAEAHSIAWGEPYLNKEQRQQVAASRADSLPDAMKQKLAALGVKTEA